MSTGSPAGAQATAILSVRCFLFFSAVVHGGGPLLCGGARKFQKKQVDGLNMLKKGLNQHNLPHLDTGIARLCRDGSVSSTS